MSSNKSLTPDYEQIGDCTLYYGDCLDVMAELNTKVQLTVTSPPYDNLRTYNNSSTWNEDVWKKVIQGLWDITADGGVVVWVVGDATIKGSETGTSFKQALYFKEVGFNLHDTMIYEKSQACFGSNNCYLQSFEYMFVFSKGRPKTMSFIRDRKNVRGGATESIVSSGMNVDGGSGVRVQKTYAILGKRKNIWRYGVGGGTTAHPAVFPEKLAQDHIVSWSKVGEVVFDPFMGSGTTGAMCTRADRKFLGVEMDAGYFDIACDRIEEAYNAK